MGKSSGYIWFDAEFTSLDLDHAQLLQVALMATDVELNRMGNPEDDFNCYIQIEDESAISDWVKEHIPEVLAACRSDQAIPIADVDTKIGAWIAERFGEPAVEIMDRPILAGNSVHNDWALARRLLPSLLGSCHYRLLDVSGLKTFYADQFEGDAFDKESVDAIKTNFPGLYLGEGMKPHDAYYDIQASLAELAWIRNQLKKS